MVDYPGEPNVVIRVLISGRGRQKKENQRDGKQRRIWPDVAGFEDGGMGF